MPKGSGPGTHKHTWSDESYRMLDGEIAFPIRDEIKTARKGDFVVVPRDTRHAFRVDTETARFLNGYTPASLEACIVERGRPATERVLPPANASPAMETFVTNPKLLSRYGLEVVSGPDPLRPAQQRALGLLSSSTSQRQYLVAAQDYRWFDVSACYSRGSGLNARVPGHRDTH